MRLVGSDPRMEMLMMDWLFWLNESRRRLRVVLYIVGAALSLGNSGATFGQPATATEESPRTGSRTTRLAAPESGAKDFPPELVNWKPLAANPVFTAQGPGHWDVKI